MSLKISQLSSTSSLEADDRIPLARNSTNKQVRASVVKSRKSVLVQNNSYSLGVNPQLEEVLLVTPTVTSLDLNVNGLAPDSVITLVPYLAAYVGTSLPAMNVGVSLGVANDVLWLDGTVSHHWDMSQGPVELQYINPATISSVPLPVNCVWCQIR